MGTIYQYSFSNKVRDLGMTLSDIIAQAPGFIRIFGSGPDARQQKHEWLEDQISPRSLTAVSIDTLTITGSTADVAKLKAGSLFTIKDDTALFRVASIDSTTTFTIVLAAANGSATTAPSAADVLNIVGTPMSGGSNNGDGESGLKESSVEYNYTQIFRKEVIMTRSALGIDIYGNENAINVQTANQLQLVARDMNRQALFGVRVNPASGVKGEAQGLYGYADELVVDGGSLQFDNYMINDAGQLILAEGGVPSIIVCAPGQARVLSAINVDKVQVIQADTMRGEYVSNVANDITGGRQVIIADYDMPDTEAFLVDPSGFKTSYLTNGHMRDEDTTTKGFDGIQRTILGELTFEMKNANQRCCRIHSLMASATAIAAIKAAS